MTLVLWVALHGPASLFGQGGTTGTFVGVVEDPSGAVLPGTAIQVRNTATNLERAETAGDSGTFTIPNLPPGVYEIRASKPGFRVAIVQDAKLDVNATFRLVIKMQVGEVAETVEVQAAAPMLQTEEASVGDVIESRRVVDLPLNGRNFEQLQMLSPGAVNTFDHQTSSGLGGGASAVAADRTPVAVSSNGSRPSQMLILVDGGNVIYMQSRTPVISPNPDEIAEFKIQASNFSAEYGYGTNVINVSTRSGTNQLRGSFWEFLRNNNLDARSFFAARVDPLKRNQFGLAVGGPVTLGRLYDGRNRTFWFFSYDGQRQRDARTVISSVPTARMRTGDLSELSARAYDPATTRRNPDIAGAFLRDPFPGNVIPANRVDPAAQLFFKWMPLPNLAGVANNFRLSPSNFEDHNRYSGRLDHRLSVRDSLMFRYAYQLAQYPYTLGPYGVSNQPYNPGTAIKDAHGTASTLGWTHIFNPTTLLDAKVAFSRLDQRANSLDVVQGGTDWTQVAGIGGLGRGVSDIFPSYPALSISGFTGLPNSSGFHNTGNNWDYIANLTVVRGRHTLKTGAEYRRYEEAIQPFGQGSGSFSFTGEYTTNLASRTGTGVGLADYLLEVPFNAGRYVPPARHYKQISNIWSYLQDDWRLSQKLTVNLGLRYEINFPTIDREDQLNSFSPSARNGRGAIVVPNERVIDPTLNPTGSPAIPLDIATYRPLIVTAQQAGVPERSLREMSWKSFAPRVGLAWRLNNQTVIRSGYGIFYSQLDGNRETEWRSAPFIIRESGLLNALDTNGQPIYTIHNFLGSTPYASTPNAIAHDPTPGIFGYTQQWNLFIQRALPGSFVVDVGYVGNHAVRLQQGRELNAPRPGPGAIQARRPFPDFTTITWNEQTGYSSYDSLQGRVERRFHAGFTVTASFSWSKSTDVDSTSTNAGFDPYDLKRDRGLSDFDSPAVVSLSAVYELPFFRSGRGLAPRLLGGWTFTSIVLARDGYPFTPTWSGDPANTGRGSRPNRKCSGTLENPTIQRWFDTSCFAAPDQYTYGNSGRNILRGPGVLNWDGGVYKDFRIDEQRRFQFRSEFFNLLNHSNFGLPASVINAGTPGVVTSSAPGRIIQMALKFYF